MGKRFDSRKNYTGYSRVDEKYGSSDTCHRNGQRIGYSTEEKQGWGNNRLP